MKSWEEHTKTRLYRIGDLYLKFMMYTAPFIGILFVAYVIYAFIKG